MNFLFLEYVQGYGIDRLENWNSVFTARLRPIAIDDVKTQQEVDID